MRLWPVNVLKLRPGRTLRSWPVKVKTPLLSGLAAAWLALGAPCSTAVAADPAASTVAVQAVAPSGDGRATVAECSGVAIAPDVVLTAGHCLDLISSPAQIAVFAYRGVRPVPTPLWATAFARHPDHVVGWRLANGDPESRRREIAADLALIRLAAPISGVAPATTGGGPSPTAVLSGVGAAGAGARSGAMKRIALSAVRPATGTGPAIVFATAAAPVCGGDSGGPVTSVGGDGLRVWGVAAAVIRVAKGCGTRFVVAPVDPAAPGFIAMTAALRR